MREAEIKEIARRAQAACAGTHEVSCPKCGGKGYAQPLYNRHCGRCDGSGRVYDQTPLVELTLKDDPKVAASLSAEDVASCRWPLCPGGPMGQLTSVDHRIDTGTIRVRFDATQLLKWAAKQGGRG